MDIKIGVSYADDRALQQSPVLLLEAYVALDKELNFVKTKLIPQALAAVSANCATPDFPSFAYVFELAIKEGTNFRYLVTPSARLVIQTLATASGYVPKSNW